MLLDDQRAAQGDHHEHAQHAAAQGDQADLHQGGRVAHALFGPHEQSRQGEDGAGGHGLTGGADGLDHVVFQNGVTLENFADDSHGNHRRRDRGRNGHADTQAQVRVRPAEDNGQNGAQDHGYHRKFGHDLVCRDVGLEFFLFHDTNSPL